MSDVEARRLGAFGGVVLAITLVFAAISFDASRRRANDAGGRAMRADLASALGLADLALSSDARWLRHPSQVEPAAALADAPGALDVDPAGAWIGPPPFAARGLRIERVNE